MLKCVFGLHSYEFVTGSLKPTGKETINWACKIVPEYIGVNKCKNCGKEITKKYITYGGK